ncbi:MAG: response regulator transcription factor [Anaerolineales bacterium]|nr:response regulator transcription factor [Anaerolineales bacterium]
MPRKTRKPGKHKRRVLLLSTHPLLGDGLQVILGGLADVDLIGPLVLDAQALDRVPEISPDVILIAEEGGPASSAAALTARLLEQCPDVPVIRVGLRQDTIRLYTSHTLPAHRADLIEAIRRLPALASLTTPAEAGISPHKR